MGFLKRTRFGVVFNAALSDDATCSDFGFFSLCAAKSNSYIPFNGNPNAYPYCYAKANSHTRANSYHTADTCTNPNGNPNACAGYHGSFNNCPNAHTRGSVL